MSGITFFLNGQETQYTGPYTRRLLDVLREDYHLTGTKCGCNEGECGACSVLLDGELVNSCMVAMGRVQGSAVTTIEGFRETPQFSVLSDAYAAAGAVQCGFCIPGMVLASQALLSHTPQPTEAQVRAGLSGNLCRCTGYRAIVHAVLAASREGAGLW